MSKQDDGGEAFPKSAIGNDKDGWSDGQKGMSLRDYFAAKAMQMLIPALKKEDGDQGYLFVSVLAYRFADAMLAERSK